MEIKPAYVTFEQAKWLKDKGFDSDYTNHCYDVSGNIRRATVTNKWIDEDGGYYNTVNVVTAPEQWQVVEWLRVNHGIWVSVIPDCGMDLIYTYKIYSVEIGVERCLVNGKNYDSPQEAYSAAFDYIKEKELI
jgi:hypothetical protein